MSRQAPDIHNARDSHATSVLIIIKAHPGADNAISSQEIADRVDPEATTVRDIVQELVADGALIGSNPDGYYWIASDEEFRREIESLDSAREETRARMQELAATWYDTGEESTT